MAKKHTRKEHISYRRKREEAIREQNRKHLTPAQKKQVGIAVAAAVLALILVGLAYYQFVDVPVRTTINNVNSEADMLQTELNKATSDVLAVYVYEQGILNAKYSYSTAVGLFNTAINIVLLIIVNTIAKKTADVDIV